MKFRDRKVQGAGCAGAVLREASRERGARAGTLVLVIAAGGTRTGAKGRFRAMRNQ